MSISLNQINAISFLQRRLETIHFFTCWGIRTNAVSDNGGHFASYAFKELANKYGFLHMTSSLHYPQVNVGVKTSVKTAKNNFETA